MSDDPGRATDSALYTRIVNSFVLTVISFGFLITAVGRLLYAYGLLIVKDDAECALKAGFSLLTIAAAIQLSIAILDVIIIFAIIKTKAMCSCRCPSLKMIGHFCTLLGVALGTLIHGIKDRDKIGWAFWVAVGGGVACLVNCYLIIQTRQMRKSLEKSGVDLDVLDRGGKIEA